MRAFSPLRLAAAYFSHEQLRYGHLHESSSLILATT